MRILHRHTALDTFLCRVIHSKKKKKFDYNPKKNIWNFWFKGYNDYDYLMVELNDYTFHRWGEMPFLVLKGYVGIEANGKKYVDIKECFIYDLIFYNNNKNNNPYSYYCDKNNLVHYFDQYGEVYYDYTYIFDTTIKNKL